MQARIIALATTLLIASLSAQAGTLPAGTQVQKTGLIQIDLDGNGSNEFDLDISGLILHDNQGNLSLNLPTTPVLDSLGMWSTGDFTDATGQVVSTNALRWHSWQTVSGSTDNNSSLVPTDTSNPWAVTFAMVLGGNVDPEMNYGFSVRNNTGSNQSYTVTFGESLVPVVSGAYTVEAQLGGATSSLPTAAGVTLTPNTTSGLMQELMLRRSSDGVFVNAGVNVGSGQTTTTAGVVNYPTQIASTSGSITGDTYDYWEFRTKFTLSGNRDTFVASGTAVLTPVPEPESWALVVAGLGVAGMLSRRRA
jgi:PEP-CTERM motif